MNTIEEKSALLSALRAIKHSQLATMTFMDDVLLNNEVLFKSYFDSPFGTPESEKMEKIFAGAVVNSIFHSKSIPDKEKAKLAVSNARSIVQMVRYGKLQYQYATNRIYARKYDELLRKNDVAQRITLVMKTKNFLLRKGGTIVISSCMASLAHAAVGAGAVTLGAAVAAPVLIGIATWGVLTFGGKLLPKSIKEPITKEYNNIQKKSLDTAVDIISFLERKRQTVVTKVKPIIEKASDTAYSIGKVVKETAGKVWNKAKETSRKVLSLFGF